MLAKLYRLPPKENFSKSAVEVKNISSEYFRILTKPNKFPHSRFGFVISKKIDKRAVARNRMRRLLSEAAKGNMQTSHGRDVLIIVKKDFMDMPTQEVFTMVNALMSKLLSPQP